MKVHELIKALSAHDLDATVEVTWEGVYRKLTPGHIYRGADGVVFIDGDDCGDKAELMKYGKKGKPYKSYRDPAILKKIEDISDVEKEYGEKPKGE